MALDLRTGEQVYQPPLAHDLNAGESYGLQFPVICGWRVDRECWMAWDRHTGEVKAFASFQPNTHGWCDGKHLVDKFTIPTNYNERGNFDADAVS